MKIVIIIGSQSDLPQCQRGLQILKKAQDDNSIIVDIYIASQHRNTRRLQSLLKSFCQAENKPDVIITGAGWANHLTGCVDAYLRYELKNYLIPVIGVGFEDLKSFYNTQAAYLSMACVPGTQAIIENGEEEPFMGKRGFLNACKFALKGEFPELSVPKKKGFQKLSLEGSIGLK